MYKIYFFQNVSLILIQKMTQTIMGSLNTVVDNGSLEYL